MDVPPPLHKLRLLCSYGGRILPRPHDRKLTYVGGDTRIIIVERHRTSIADLRRLLSKILPHHHSFFLKYQLPNEDLDSLISLTTDEDLENMAEEYDRITQAAARGSNPVRLRLFLLPATPDHQYVETTASSSKSDDWFFNVLNGNATIPPESSPIPISMNSLLGLDDDSPAAGTLKPSSVGKDVQSEESKRDSGEISVEIITNQDAQSLPDSLETSSSSCGSSSSSPSIAYPRPAPDDNLKVATEEQFQQMNLQDGQIHGGRDKVKKQIPHFLLKPQPSGFDFDSPDSVSCEGNLKSPLSRQRQCVGNLSNQACNLIMNNDCNDSKYQQAHQYDQIPAVHPMQQLVQCIPAGPVPVSSYYNPTYPSQHQYPVYFVPSPSGYGKQGPSRHPQTSINLPSPTYRRAGASTLQFLQIPPSPHQPQHVAYMKIQPISSPVGDNKAYKPMSSPVGDNKAYKFGDPINAQTSYAWHEVGGQFQIPVSMADASAQLPRENVRHWAGEPGRGESLINNL